MARRRRHTPPFDLTLDRLGPKSCAVGTHDGQEVMVRSAPPGAVVHVVPFKRKQGVIHARRVHMVERPADYQEPPCTAFGLCGGCSLQELNLQAQRREKQRRIIGLFPGVVPRPIAGAPAAFGYRNKVELSFGTRCFLTEADNAAGKSIHGRFLGFHAPGRFDRVVDVERCEIADPRMNAVISAVKGWYSQTSLAPWDVREHVGFLKHLVVRASSVGQVLVALYTAPPEAQDAPVEQIEDELRALAATLPADGVLWFVNERVADAAIGPLREVLAGQTTIDEALGPVRYQLSATAFFQTNTAGAEVLYDVVAEAAGSGRRVLDLYCGTGAIGLYLGDRFQEVLGIEMNEAAVADARLNAQRNERSNIQYKAGKVEDNLPALRDDDIAIVDPPRAGLHPKVAEYLANSGLSTLVYVACKPESLARDRAVFEAAGWTLEWLQAVDLFPQTGHIEVVARFVR
ncbi:MAG: 23S rRNA (uracil(1939)-C(5))-methyltransferase RlmD [Myxococcota bacterium]|nr:23S rRNA (uracil(1939)-C(5))-methyltransferase RlmD [Myxococcota bacterium]